MRAVLLSRVHCLFTIFTLPIIHLVYHPPHPTPPLESNCLQSLLRRLQYPGGIEKYGYAKYGVTQSV